MELVQNFNYGLSRKIASRQYAGLLAWLKDKTPKLADSASFSYSISTRVFWVRNGMADFPKCDGCGKTIGEFANVTLKDGYPSHCSLVCAFNDPTVIRRKEEEFMRKFGVRNVLMSKKIQEQIRQTNIKKYGVDNYTKTPEYKEKQKAGFRRHYGADHNMKTEQGRMEWSDSYFEKTGYRHNWSNPECREREKLTIKAKYGTENNMQSKAGYAEWQAAVFEKYGVDHNWKSDECRAAGILTMIARYGVPYWWMDDEMRSAAGRRYCYDGRHFDSAPEIAFYIWLKDCDVEFSYGDLPGIPYKHAGATHLYCPDFLVEGVITEIKGDQFFREDGTMYCPFRDKSWSDEQYESVCALYEAKHQYA